MVVVLRHNEHPGSSWAQLLGRGGQKLAPQEGPFSRLPPWHERYLKFYLILHEILFHSWTYLLGMRVSKKRSRLPGPPENFSCQRLVFFPFFCEMFVFVHFN